MPRSSLSSALLAGAAAAALCASNAAAQSSAPKPAEPPAAAFERRGGFALGLLAGAAFGTASGNPKALAYRLDPTRETNLVNAYGYRITPFVGGAITNWFTVGLGLSFGRMQTAWDHATNVTTFVFHLEAFPLYTKGGMWRDVGLSADFGAGAASIRNTTTGKEVANAGVASAAGVGAFWEPLRLWHVRAGPSFSYQHNWSEWFSRDDVTVGLRCILYGAP